MLEIIRQPRSLGRDGENSTVVLPIRLVETLDLDGWRSECRDKLGEDRGSSTPRDWLLWESIQESYRREASEAKKTSPRFSQLVKSRIASATDSEAGWRAGKRVTRMLIVKKYSFLHLLGASIDRGLPPSAAVSVGIAIAERYGKLDPRRHGDAQPVSEMLDAPSKRQPACGAHVHAAWSLYIWSLYNVIFSLWIQLKKGWSALHPGSSPQRIGHPAGVSWVSADVSRNLRFKTMRYT